MKLSILTAAIALNLCAQDTPRIACLVGTDAKMVYSVDVEQYQTSAFIKFFPVWSGWPTSPPLPVKRIVATLSDVSGGRQPVLILEGSGFSGPMLTSQSGNPNELRNYQGFPALAISDEGLVVVLSPTLALEGDTGSVSRVMDRLSSQNCTGAIADKIADLNGSYDAWFMALRPMEQIDVAAMMPKSQWREELAQAIEEIHGGVRLGRVNSITVELTTKDPQDASALATLARWLPELTSGSPSPESKLVESIENFQTRSSGSTASLSFLLPEAAVKAVQADSEKRAAFADVQ